jgi:3-methyladenine DNA glycosylase AlkC
MPEPLKLLYNKEFINSLSDAIKLVYSPFNSQEFNTSVFDKEWDNKELLQRLRHIAYALHQFLPENYLQAIKILDQISPQFSGLEHLVFPAFVELYGLDELEQSIKALESFTQYSTSELAIRPFIIKYPDRMMAQMEIWAESPNHHVRRLASEGCRPRLPWALSLPKFKKNPQAVLKILEKLKLDKSDYVKKSVANNLNDISKDHSQTVIDLAKNWLGDNKDTDWIVKHACRTLLKKANREVLTLFGFGTIQHIELADFIVQPEVKQGDKLNFSFVLNTTKDKLGKLRIEYAMDFMKNNGKQARKIFKISESDFTAHIKSVQKQHSFKKISTRKYYPGKHGLAIIVNGQEMGVVSFLLI